MQTTFFVREFGETSGKAAIITVMGQISIIQVVAALVAFLAGYIFSAKVGCQTEWIWWKNPWVAGTLFAIMGFMIAGGSV